MTAGHQTSSTVTAEALDHMDGGRPLPLDREVLGRMVREAWVRWAQTQSNPKASWLLPYEALDETDKEADRQIGEAVARWTLIADAARSSVLAQSAPDPDAWMREDGSAATVNPMTAAQWKGQGMTVVPLYVGPAQLQPQWQPIETAPQDGTAVLATGGGLAEVVDIVTYSESVGAWNATNYTLDDRDDESQGYSRPKYWMPLPKGPAFPSASSETEPSAPAPESSR